MKKIKYALLTMLCITLFIMAFMFTAGAATYSGSCGSNVQWSLDAETGVLDITGTGSMSNYFSTSSSGTYITTAPWGSYISKLKTVNISNGVTSIGNDAFYNCSGLTSITIPDGVTSIGYEAFSYCTGLTSITIPDSVTSIGYEAFSYCTGLTSITIPDSVTSIGGYAFRGCTGLTSITIPDSVTSIGYEAFSYCTGLTSVTILNSVTSIGGYAFRGCTGLTSISIPDGVTSIGDYAFSGCTGLTSISIPDGVTSIGYYAFSDCTGLTSISIPDGVTSIGDYAFYNCRGLTSITIPDGVTSIGDYAFYNCRGLTSITIPDGVTSIGDSAFSGCTGLTSISIPDGVTSIGSSAFSGCTGLTSISIPDGVTSIGSSAFSGCTGLTSITIPNSVTSIGSSAFRKCTGLTTITIPDSVTSIGSYAFDNCWSIRNTCFFGTAEQWGTISIGSDNYDLTNNVKFDCFVYDDIVYQPKENSIAVVYANRTLSGKNTIPNKLNNLTVTEIEAYAFSGCTGLASITIPDSVTSIGDYAFSGCVGLKEVNIPAGILSYSFNDMRNLPALEKVDVSSFNRNYCSVDGVVFNKTKTELLFYPLGKADKEYSIPGGTKGCNSNAFGNVSALEKVVVPDSVTNFQPSDFYSCENLKVIESKDYTSVDGVLYSKDKKSLIKALGGFNSQNTDFIIPNGVTSIRASAFSECTKLTSITIPDSVTSIGNDAFRNCIELASVTIGNSVTSIGNNAFYNCTKLTSITIPDSVTSIGGSAFSGCNSLVSVALSNKLTSVGSYTFSGCTSLKNVYIPIAVKHIYSNAFYNCNALEKVYYSGTQEQWYADDFSIDAGNEILQKPNIVVYNSLKCFHSQKELTDWTLKSPATCTEKAVYAKTCTVCGAAEEIYVKYEAALGHNFVRDKARDKAPTLTSTGLEAYSCTRCNAKNDKVLGKLKDADFVKETSKLKIVDGNSVALAPKLSFAELQKNLPENVKLIIPDGAEILCTGMKITLKYGGAEKIITVVVMGDIDGNGEVTAADARLALRYAVGLERLEGAKAQAAKVGMVATVSAAQARMILRAAVGLDQPEALLEKKINKCHKKAMQDFSCMAFG